MSTLHMNWSSYSCFFSAEYSQSYLKKCYRSLHIADIDSKSYQNCYPFMYFLENGKLYYEQARNAPINIKPVLLFYGLVHFIKACLLTVDPDYPSSTSVLAHGVSSRKLKKQGYLFSQDEVKVQKNGLFTFMSEKLFHYNHLDGEKVKMGYLFQQIPELSDLIFAMDGNRTYLPVEYEYPLLSLPKEILSAYYMNEQQLQEYLQNSFDLSISKITRLKDQLQVELFEPLRNHKLVKWDKLKKIHCISTDKEPRPFLTELISHYILLYNLSMIARYEIEWWSELLKTMPNKDFPYIESFLAITTEKGPQLISELLLKNTI